MKVVSPTLKSKIFWGDEWSLREKPNIRARIHSNKDRRTPRIPQCSDVFDFGWLEIHPEYSIRIRPVFPYSNCNVALDVLRRYSDHLWLEHLLLMTRTFFIFEYPQLFESLRLEYGCTTPLLKWTSSNTNGYVKYALIFENRTLWTRKLCRIFHSQRCLASSSTGFIQVIYTIA